MERKSLIAWMILMILMSSCQKPELSREDLQNVLAKVEQIESASYHMQGENWNPGDTAASAINQSFVNEYDNPADSTIGAKFVLLNPDNPSLLEFCYDGQMRALVYHDEKMIVLDSFKIRPLPFRPLTPPFFNYAKNILRYALETSDSISLEIKDQESSFYVRLTIHEDQQVEFFGKAHAMEATPYTFGDNTSVYEIWIHKSDRLPYKIRREMSHNISIVSCTNYKLNHLEIKDFKASEYFPEGYAIQSYRLGGGKQKEHALLGKKAPEWILQSDDHQMIALSELKSKVLLVQFTSVSCGPCRLSIPFLRQLSKEYPIADFDLVSIESTSRNLDVLKNYRSRNSFDFKFLQSNQEVLQSYSIQSYPVFFILDENRLVQKVLNGYGEGTTDEVIRKSINELLHI